MAFEQVKIEGVKELNAALLLLENKVATKIGVDAAREGAEHGRDRMRAAAPYDPSHRLKTWTLAGGGKRSAYYGHLRDNIKTLQRGSKRDNYIVFDITTGDAFWGYFQEFGTVKMPAHPWARRTAETMKDEVVRIQIAALEKGIEQVARDAPKGPIR